MHYSDQTAIPVSLNWETTKVSFGSIFGRVRCEPGWRLEPGWSDRLTDFDLWFVWGGSGRLWLTDGEVELRPGTCIWMRPGRTYIAEQDPADRLGVSFVHFSLADGQTGKSPPAAALPAEVHRVDPIYVEALLANVLAQLTPVIPRPPDVTLRGRAAALRLFEGFLMQLDLAPPERPGSPAARRRQEAVQKVATLIRDEPARPWRVSALARDAGFGADHFARAFKEIVGQAPRDFIVEARIERARHLLTETCLPVGLVASALAYSSPFFFSRQFRERTGLTPLQYRRAATRPAPEASSTNSPGTAR